MFVVHLVQMQFVVVIAVKIYYFFRVLTNVFSRKWSVFPQMSLSFRFNIQFTNATNWNFIRIALVRASLGSKR